MSPKMHNKHAFSPGVLDMYEIMSCFITESHILIWKPITFSWDVLYDKQFENYWDDNDNYKI